MKGSVCSPLWNGGSRLPCSLPLLYTSEVPLVRACRSTDVPPGSAKRVVAHGLLVAVFRLIDGTLKAIPDACPHQEGALSRGLVDACPDGPCVTCPLHGLRISLANGALSGGDPGVLKETHAARVPLYAVEERDEWVFIEFPEQE